MSLKEADLMQKLGQNITPSAIFLWFRKIFTKLIASYFIFSSEILTQLILVTPRIVTFTQIVIFIQLISFTQIVTFTQIFTFTQIVTFTKMLTSFMSKQKCDYLSTGRISEKSLTLKTHFFIIFEMIV